MMDCTEIKTTGSEANFNIIYASNSTGRCNVVLNKHVHAQQRYGCIRLVVTDAIALRL